MSVSVPFFTVSMQPGETHWFDVQTKLVQSDAVTHSTQEPAPSQTLPPAELHVAPSPLGMFCGAPFAQRSVVHSLLSSRRSASSGSVVTVPCPSQTSRKQSPAVSTPVAVPAGASTNPHTPSTQVRLRQTVSVPGQSAAVAHSGPPPWPPPPPLPPFWAISDRSTREINSQPVDDPSSMASSPKLDAASAFEAERLHRLMLFSTSTAPSA